MGEYSKLDGVKMMGTHGKINAIWWNIKINLQNLVGYEDMNSEQICKISRKNTYRNAKIPKKMFFGGGYFFLKHPVYCAVFLWIWLVIFGYSSKLGCSVVYCHLVYLILCVWETRGQSNLTKSAVRGHPRGRKLYHWIPGVGFPISVP